MGRPLANALSPALAFPICLALAFALSFSISEARAEGTTPAAPPTPGLMVVAHLEGSASGEPPGGGRSQPLLEGEKLSEGTTVSTGTDSRMEISFASGTLVRIGESTRLTLREAPPEGKQFRAKLWAGNFWAHVHKLLEGERFEVETENGVAGVRGTIFRVEVKAGESDLLRVYEGVVQVDGSSGFVHRVELNHELRFAKETAGPAAFDPASESANPFMQWVNARERELDGKDKSDKKERQRDRLRRQLRHE